jgi:hypothetical protein
MPLQDGFLIKLNGGNRESYKLALTNYNKDIRKAKWPSQQNYCGGTKNVPNRAWLMRIMTRQLVNRVGSVKLPNGWHTKTGEETLEELYKVHFPGSVEEEVTLPGQG